MIIPIWLIATRILPLSDSRVFGFLVELIIVSLEPESLADRLCNDLSSKTMSVEVKGRPWSFTSLGSSKFWWSSLRKFSSWRFLMIWSIISESKFHVWRSTCDKFPVLDDLVFKIWRLLLLTIHRYLILFRNLWIKFTRFLLSLFLPWLWLSKKSRTHF